MAPQWQVLRGGRGAATDDKKGAPGTGASSDTQGVAAALLSSPELARLKRITASGVPNLVLHAGERRGTTLHHLAQVDPEYLKTLACEARTPAIRLAAKRLVEYLGLNQQRRRNPPPRGRRPVIRSSDGRDGTPGGNGR